MKILPMWATVETCNPKRVKMTLTFLQCIIGIYMLIITEAVYMQTCGTMRKGSCVLKIFVLGNHCMHTAAIPH